MRLAWLLVALLAGCTDAANTQKLPIGSRCTSASQCGTSPYDCATMGYPGGYCDKPCTTHGDCPADSLCSPTVHACRRRCGMSSDCRVMDGYGCVAIDPNNSVCEAGVALDGGRPSG